VIAARIGRNPSVVRREIAGHGGRERYRATRAARVAARTRCWAASNFPDSCYRS
jgi:IS30 family transposase